MKPRVYVDTSVLGGCEDEEFSEHSIRLMETFARGERVLVLSILTIQELTAAPASVRQRLASVPEPYIETLPLDAEAEALAEEYVAAGVLTARMRADAQHIAMATLGARAAEKIGRSIEGLVEMFPARPRYRMACHGDGGTSPPEGWSLPRANLPWTG